MGRLSFRDARAVALIIIAPFCGPKVFKPTTELHMVKYHVSNHLSLAVQHQGKLNIWTLFIIINVDIILLTLSVAY